MASQTYRLEPRTLMDATVVGTPAVVNVSRKPGQQTEAWIAMDPSSAGARVFVASNEAGASQFGAVSTDGGATFATREFATGADGLPQACCDPTAAFDEFGNLFFAYLAQNGLDTHVVLSTDGGRSFSLIGTFDDDGDQPTLATGPGRTPGSRTVWIAFNAGNTRGVAYGADVTGLGQVGTFGRQLEIGGPTARNVGDIAIGPAGQALVAYQTPNNEGPSDVFVQLDPDGLGRRRFAGPVRASGTNVGDFDRIPAQPRRTIDAAVGLAYDRSGGPFTGRAYLVYTDESANESDDTDVLLRFSDDDGATWSAPIRVNDDGASGRSQFLPRVAVDQTSGNVGIAWHDARNDSGDPAAGGGANATPNDEAQFYAAVGTPTRDGVTISPNVQVTGGFSHAPSANNPLDYGDYIGVAFQAGRLMPSWAGNSNSTGDNPDGARAAFDVYTARLDVQDPTPNPARELIGQFGSGAGGRTIRFTANGGVPVTLTLSGGTGYAFRRDGDLVDLRLVDHGRGVSLSVRGGGGGRVWLGDVVTNGSIRKLTGKTADLFGTMSATGAIGSVALGNVTGTVSAAGGEIRSLSASSLTNARVLSGADVAANAFAPGTIRRLTVAGAITSSLVGAGLDPVNGTFGDADDRVLGGAAASVIDSVTARGGADEATRFVAAAFGRARLPRSVDVTTDPRFRVL